MGFAAIHDQDVALQLLRNTLRTDRIPGAFLFWGPDGVGKHLAAIEMARAVNCRESVDDACDTCLSCRKVSSGNHPDLQTVQPASKTRVIKTQIISDVIDLAMLSPREGRRRVFIILDAERITPEGQNKFLKTLEEPPGNSLFILVTHQPRLLLPTIRSRCQVVRFRALRPETVIQLLQRERSLPDELTASVAALAQGQMSRALDMVDSEKRTLMLSFTQRLADGEDPVLLAEEFVSQLSEQRKQVEADIDSALDAEEKGSLPPEERDRIKEERVAAVAAVLHRELLEYLYLLETWYRDQLVYSMVPDPSNHVLNLDQLDRLTTETSTDAAAKIAAIERCRRLLDRHISEERVFRDMFLALAAP